jgi:hypothetical protein
MAPKSGRAPLTLRQQVVRTILLEKLLTLKGLREKSAHLRDRVAYFTRWHRASPQVRLEIIEAEGNEWRNDDGEIVGTEIDDYRSNPAALPRRVLGMLLVLCGRLHPLDGLIRREEDSLLAKVQKALAPAKKIFEVANGYPMSSPPGEGDPVPAPGPFTLKDEAAVVSACVKALTLIRRKVDDDFKRDRAEWIDLATSFTFRASDRITEEMAESVIAMMGGPKKYRMNICRSTGAITFTKVQPKGLGPIQVAKWIAAERASAISAGDRRRIEVIESMCTTDRPQALLELLTAEGLKVGLKTCSRITSTRKKAAAKSRR